MGDFVPKKLPQDESVGTKLRRARLQAGLSLEAASRQTGIRLAHLQALEEERFDRLPQGLYGKNFLKRYAAALGLKPQALLAELAAEQANDNPNDPFSQKVVKKNKLIIFPKVIRRALVFLAVLICLLYLVFYFQRIVFPPHLEVSRPADNLITRDPLMEIYGRTEPEAEVRINDELVLSDREGGFRQEIHLKHGLNTISVTAKKKYSREAREIRQIILVE